MREFGLTNQVKTIRVMNGVAVGTSSQTSSIVDTAGFEGVRFTILFGTITDGPPSIKVQQGQQSNMSDAADLAGSSVAVANSDDNKMAMAEVIRPAERYVQVVVTRGGATGCVIDGMIAELFGPKSAPVSQDTSVAAQETSITPAEGTA